MESNPGHRGVSGDLLADTPGKAISFIVFLSHRLRGSASSTSRVAITQPTSLYMETIVSRKKYKTQLPDGY